MEISFILLKGKLFEGYCPIGWVDIGTRARVPP
jgi:hypothetical protein